MAELKGILLSILLCLLSRCVPSLQDVNVTLVVSVTRNISSPNYPSYYHNDAYYNWYITAPEGYDTLVHFFDFRTEFCCDYLRIGTGDSLYSPGSVEIARLYGSSIPSDIRLDTTTSWIQFTSDHSVTERGFQLQLSLINSTNAPTTVDATTGWWWGTTDYPGDFSTEYPTKTLQSTTYAEDFTTRRPLTEEPATVRLVNGNEAHEGRVEVLHNGVWGTVCDDGWDMNDARVVCRSLGYRDALSAPWNARFGQGNGPIWMDNVSCLGNEAHIFNCPHNGFGNHNCGHDEDASVVCEPDEAELTCDSTSMTLIMDRTLLEIGDDARDVHFEDESCIGYDHDSQHVAITTSYDRCGTKQEQDEDYIGFSNLVTFYKPRPENGTNQLVTREHYLHIPVICYMEREQLLGGSFSPKIGKLHGEEKGYGEFLLSFDRYTNAGFYQPANDSGKVELGTPLYFGVGLNSVTNLTLLIESCWATSSPYPLDDHRYDIIGNGSAVDSTTYIYSWLSPTFKGFRIDAFAFIGDYEQVYVHCSILICDNSDSDSRCAQGCLTRSRRSLQPTGSRSKPHTITQGPLSDASHLQHVMMVDNDYGGTGTFDPLMIAAMSALCVLIALTVIMSLVIVRMRRHRLELIGYRRVGVTEDY